MDILIIMLAGMLAGRFIVPNGFRVLGNRLQTLCTCLLIAAMGTSIGSAEGFVERVAAWGAQSLVFCIAPMACSVLLVYALTNKVLKDGSKGALSSSDVDVQRDGGLSSHPGTASSCAAALREDDTFPATHPRAALSRASWRPDGMAVAAVIMVTAGIVLGVLAPASPLVKLLAAASEPLLMILMALVGVSVGMHRGLGASIREHHIKTLVIPLGVIVGSLAGGCLAALACGVGLREGMAAASGLGWYSLAGVTIESVAGAQLGGIAFLSNLMREMLSFICIPWIARRFNGYACIAAAAATSEDTTLPMMIRYTDERCVVYSLVNGVICSAVVPVLITLCLG